MTRRKFAFHSERLESHCSSSLVFRDPKNRRKRGLQIFLCLLGAFICSWTFLFLSDVTSPDTLSDEVGHRLGISDHSHGLDHQNIEAGTSIRDSLHLAAAPVAPGREDVCEPSDPPPFSAMADVGDANRFMAHVPIDNQSAYLSLKDSCGVLGTLSPDWLTIRYEEGSYSIQAASRDTRSGVEEFRAQAKFGVRLMPVVQIAAGRNMAAAIDGLLRPDGQAAVAGGLLRAVHRLDAQGVCIDFSQSQEAELLRLTPFFAGLQTQFERAGLETCLVISARNGAWRDAGLVSKFNQVVVKMFRETWTGTASGPLSDLAWVKATAAEARDEIGQDKLVAAVGSFAVDWVSGSPFPEKLSFSEAMQRISQAQGDVQFSTETSNSFSTFRDASGRIHKIWMIDAVSVHNQLKVLSELGIPGVAVWSLGSEDPGIWNVLENGGNDLRQLASSLSVVNLKNYVHYQGAGAFLRILKREVVGVRRAEFDQETGLASDQRYTTLPSPYLVEKYGGQSGRKLVLTFDDGPEPAFTTPILDSLKAANVPATFFVVGSRVMGAQSILERMVRDGHEIGAHSFSHQHMGELSSVRSELEFSLTHKAIAGASGHETRIYREPFQRNGGPIRAERVRTLETAQEHGLILAGMDIAPKDWEGWTAEQIAGHVITEVESGAGNVILLHDGGQDRSETVAAVPVIIEALQARGYEFTTLSDLLGMDRADLMPKADPAAVVVDSLSFATVAGAQNFLTGAFWFVLCIGVLRSIFIMLLSFARRPNRPVASGTVPKVSIVIPAFNEEKVIAASIQSALASDYPNFEVVVVDDGSSDSTISEVLRFSMKPNFRIITQPNQGKWSALNRAIMQLDSEIAVCLDADTQMQPDAVSRLVRHFSNPKVGAVAGKIMVGNRVNLLTRLQGLEYATSQNAERMAYDALNGILVVPGAIGAWRVQALQEAGMYRADTLTEDSDLTISVNRCGYRVLYDETARAWTEAPETVRQLLAQRLRWSLGMFQSSWKHKKAIFEGRLIGLVSIPDMLIFGYLFPILAPVADLFFAILIWTYLQGGADAVSQDVFWAYCALPLMEFLLVASALLRDEDESAWSLLLFPIHRIFYRPLLYFSVIRSLTRALSGRLAGWGKQDRQGRVAGAPVVGE